MPRYNPHEIEPKWQRYWEEQKTFRAVEDPSLRKLYILDMFPYPSGEGLHVGHPEGYTATDIYARYMRMRGYNVLHPMGYDAFGLPAEQYAIQTGTHPRVTTERNIATIRRQIKRFGFSYDWDREFATTDPQYYKWTQWIFLVIFDTWFDPDYEWTDPTGRKRKGKGRPIAELPIPEEIQAQGPEAVRRYQDRFRLAYQAEAPVNWCPALGTVLADEEVIGGRSERGGHPVERIPLRQWMLRITAYADRLLEDLELLDWPESIKEMQRNWIGRSEGAEADFPIADRTARDLEELKAWVQRRRSAGYPEEPDIGVIRIYTTRPDTLFGATYMVLAPEHPLVDLESADCIVPDAWPEHTPLHWKGDPPADTPRAAVAAYQERVRRMSEEERIAGVGEKTGVFTGAFAINPVNGERIPIWIADYVLVTYGTGAIMAVPAHDERDYQFARRFQLPIRPVVRPPASWLKQHLRVPAEAIDAAGFYESLQDERFFAHVDEAFVEDGVSIASSGWGCSISGLPTAEAKRAITQWLEQAGIGRKAVKYKLRDWLFSRQRYWGEPFPILHEVDEEGNPTGLVVPVPAEELPVELPELEDFKPTGRPEPPLEKAEAWKWVERNGRRYKRETNTMPQWAGSCWYYLRFCDPKNDTAAWDRAKERYWMPVDLYVGGAEHAVLHLLYARFWHKVLFDRGYVSTMEPFQRLVNQGMILSTTYRTAEGRIVPYKQIRFVEGKAYDAESGEELKGEPEKMSKSRGNVIPVDIPLDKYGADCTRLYEMFMGPLEVTKPWSMEGIQGVYRFLHRVWRMIVDEDAPELRLHPAVQDVEPTDEQQRVLHRTIQVVTEDIERLRFNTAISRLMEFVNFFLGQQVRPRIAMERFVLLLAPLAPHMAEELWQLLGHEGSLAYERWPEYEERWVRVEQVRIPVQVNGKVRATIEVAADADAAALQAAALENERIQKYLQGRQPRKVIAVPGRIVNIVL